MFKVSILDGYVDEPSCLGVPPFISPYPRYIAGAIWSVNKSSKIFYVTIDQLRNDKSILDILSKSNMIIVISGISVPGKYLSGFPASPNEIISLLNDLTGPIKILCGPSARYGFGISGGKKTREIFFVEDVFDLIIKGDGEIVIYDLLKNNGEMVYATCTYNPDENESVIHYLLENRDAELLPVNFGFHYEPGITMWRDEVYDKQMEQTARFYPHHIDSVGFFMARIGKRG